MPRIANLLVSGPGEIKACIGEPPIVSLQWGNLIHYRTDTFTSTYIADALAEGSAVSPQHIVMLLSRILKNVQSFGHGGHIIIVPNDYNPNEYTRIKYNLPISFMFRGGGSDLRRKNKEKDVISYADMISKLTSVDGGVILTKDLDLLGFGAETLQDSFNGTEPRLCFIGYDNEVDNTKRFTDNGMRHRSCYMFCNAVEGAVALIISQDGFIEACTKRDGKVLIYDSVSFSVL